MKNIERLCQKLYKDRDLSFSEAAAILACLEIVSQDEKATMMLKNEYGSTTLSALMDLLTDEKR